MQNDAVGTFEYIGSGINVSGLKFVVRALHNQNTILPRGVDENGCHSAGDAFHLTNVGCVDSEILEVLDGCRTKQIAADARDHKNFCSAEFGCYCLVCPFAAEAQVEFISEDGFAGLRKLIGVGYKVDVRASDNGNAAGERELATRME